jgi:hypothetical protein
MSPGTTLTPPELHGCTSPPGGHIPARSGAPGATWHPGRLRDRREPANLRRSETPSEPHPRAGCTRSPCSMNPGTTLKPPELHGSTYSPLLPAPRAPPRPPRPANLRRFESPSKPQFMRARIANRVAQTLGLLSNRQSFMVQRTPRPSRRPGRPRGRRTKRTPDGLRLPQSRTPGGLHSQPVQRKPWNYSQIAGTSWMRDPPGGHDPARGVLRGATWHLRRLRDRRDPVNLRRFETPSKPQFI